MALRSVNPTQTSTILVVDDLSSNARLLERLLVAAGHQVVTAGDGLEALKIVATTRPDMILMDVRMPKCDGFEACQRLKQYTDDLDSAESVILSLALTVEARDPYTQGHCERLAAYAVSLGQRLGLPEEDLAALHRGGYLHDI